MKNIITISIIALLSIGTFSCSSTRDTERADPQAKMNKPMRDRNQANTETTAGHQNDEIRENNR